MKRQEAGLSLLILLGLMLTAGCHDQVTEQSTAPEPVSLMISFDVTGTAISVVVAEVTAADLDTAIVDTLTVQNDTVAGTLTIPAGSDRLLTLRAYDDAGIETHRGSTTLTVQEGSNPPVVIILNPLTGSQPVTGVLSDIAIIARSGSPDPLRIGTDRQAEAVVVNGSGDTISTSVAWATFDPTVATVSETGLLTGVDTGSTRIVVTYGGVAAEFSLTVVTGAELVRHHLSTAYHDWFHGNYDYEGPGLFLSNASFQHSAPWDNAGMEVYARLPRVAIVNDTADDSYPQIRQPWIRFVGALEAVVEARRELVVPGTDTTFAENELAAVQAYMSFVQGLAHASLATLYDRAVIVDQTTRDRALSPYQTVIDTALVFFDQAIAVADTSTFTIPFEWIPVEGGVPAADLAQAAHSMKARFRAAVARTPQERAEVDWSAVIADVDAGLSNDWVQNMDPYDGWYSSVVDYGTYPGWAEDPYFILGMADQSGNYQRWLATPLADRIPNPDADGDSIEDPILIITPDLRFAQGSTVAEQDSTPGVYFVIPYWDIQNVWKRPDRGTWRWSYYWHVESEQYTYWNDFHWPEIDASELQLLKAEGLYRTGDFAGAAAIVNATRTGAGLTATDASGTNADCVPRLPDESCGGLFEMIKWEKRMEARMKGLFAAPWYFDSRGWGDLYSGTYLQLPVPCDILQDLTAETCYTFGATEGMAAPVSSYAWPEES